MSVTASCHCGAVQLVLSRAPTEVTECNCSICRRYGVIWAYYDLAEVQFVPERPLTHTYVWGDRAIAFHRCANCGCVTHWWPEPGRDQGSMGVNARLFAPEILASARLRHLDGAVTEAYID
jgi:hypothetical protein